MNFFCLPLNFDIYCIQVVFVLTPEFFGALSNFAPEAHASLSSP